jgi:hypothetical protein
MVSTKGQKDSR